MKIDYLEGSDWKSYQDGRNLLTGQLERDDSENKLMINVKPFNAKNVKITIPADSLPKNEANAAGYIGGRVDLRVNEN